MDERRFDELARHVAGSPSRRRVLRTLAGGAVGGLLAAVGLGKEAAAVACTDDDDCDGCQRCGTKGRCVAGCRSGKRCCGGACVDPKLCCTTPEECGPCRRCADGRCVARPDGKLCSECKRCIEGRCANPDDDL